MTPEKSNWTSGERYSMSKATICDFRRRRWRRRNNWESVGEDLVSICLEALTRDRVVLWTIWWAKSSKTEEFTRR